MDWSPDAATISQVLLMLQALRDPTCASHQQAIQTLSTDTANPTFVLHLVHIFSRGGSYEGIPTDIRQLAGLITKNYIFPRLVELAEDVFRVVKAEIMHGLADPVPTIRNTAALLVGRITAAFMSSFWVDIIESLLGGAIELPANMTELEQQGDQSIISARIDGSLLAIKRICEDSAEKLFMDTENRPLETLIPQLIAVFRSPVPSHRLKAIESINALIYLLPSDGSSLQTGVGSTPCALVAHMASFLASLSHMASDPSASIRRAVCQALVLLTTFQVAVLVPMLAEVCQFMLHNISDQDEGVAMEACEFWWEFLKNRESAEFLLLQHDAAGAGSVLSTLIPALISRFPLTTEQIEFEREEDAATASGEREVNFKPVHHTSKSSGRNEDDDSDGEEEEGGGAGGEGGVSLWTLRKQAARVLDLLAYSLPPQVTLSIALPVVQEKFGHSDVWVYETGMLTLGALSHGCSQDMAEYLPDLLPILLSSVQGHRGGGQSQSQEFPPEVRCISCWVLGRYSDYWFTEGGEDEEYSALPPREMDIEVQKSIIQTLMTSMVVEGVPRLQAASCSALTAVFDSVAASEGGHDDPTAINILDTCLPAMVAQFHHAFGMFGVKNSLILCDTVGTLCDAIAPNSLQSMFSANASDMSSLILNPVVTKFSQLLQMQDPSFEGGEDSCAPHPHLYPVMECLTSVSTAVGLDLLPFATDLVKMLLQLIAAVMDAHDQHYAELEAGASVEDLEEVPGIDFAVCALDVLSSIVEGLKVAFPVVVLGLFLDPRAMSEMPISPEHLQPYCHHGREEEIQRMVVFQVVRCMSFSHSSDLRQSAFSLVGDLVSEGVCAALFSSPLATSIALSFPPVTPRNEAGVDFLQESFMKLCTEAGEEERARGHVLTPCVLYLFQLCVYQIDTQSALVAPLVANNAVWVIGEYCLAIGAGPVVDTLIAPLACQITGLLQHIMTLDGTNAAAIQTFGQEESHSPLALKQNLAITLGRLAYLSPSSASSSPSPLLSSPEGACLQSFCRACALIQPSPSRDHAFLGLLALLHVNPQALLQNPAAIEQFCFACNSWQSPPYDHQLLSGLRDVLLACTSTPIWPQVMRVLKGGERLHHVFQLR